MKTQVMAKGLRLTLSTTEVHSLMRIVDGAVVPENVRAEIGKTLRLAEMQISAGRVAGADNARRDRIAKIMRDACTDNRTVDGYTVQSHLSDYGDHSRDPDRRSWVDERIYAEKVAAKISFLAIAPEQREVRRDVWHVIVMNPLRELDDQSFTLGDGCTEGSARAEIEIVARQIIQSARGEEA